MASEGANMREAKILAVEDLNAAGGVLGRPVEIIFFDSKELLAETFAAAAEKLIFQEEVDAIIASYSGESGPATFRQYDQPFIYGEPSRACIALYTDAREQAFNVFLGAASGFTYGPDIFNAVMDLTEVAGYEFPNNKLQILTGPWEWSFDHGDGMAPVAEAAGWEVPGTITVALETREWAGVQAGIRQFDPAMIFMEAYDTGCIGSFDLQLNTDPINTLIAHSQVSMAPDFLDLLGEDANGIFGGAVADVIPGDPAGQSYQERYEVRWGRPAPKSESAKAYDYVNMWAAAVERVGDPTDYRAIATAIEDYPYEGLCGTFAFNEDHYVPNLPFHIYQVQNGEWVPLWTGGEMTEAQMIVPPWIE